MMTATKPKIRVTVEHDEDTESPMDWECAWRLISFNRRHINSGDYEDYFDVMFDEDLAKTNGRKAATTLEPNNIGLRRKLDVGTAFTLSYFEHGNCVWSLPGSGPQCQWDNAEFAGLLLWEHSPKEMGAKTYKERAKDAASFLKQYTHWCNGECYWYKIEKITEDDEEEVGACGCFIGDENIKEAVAEELLAYKDYEIEYAGDYAWTCE